MMTASHWLVGRRIVEAEQAGESRAEHGKDIFGQLSADLTARFVSGFGRSNLFQMRAFFLARPKIVQTTSGQSVHPEHGPEKAHAASGLFTGSQEAETPFGRLGGRPNPEPGRCALPLLRDASNQNSR